jgi:transposase
VVARRRNDPQTCVDAARRTAKGKNVQEIRRCLKRVVARQLCKLLERDDRGQVKILSAA